MAALDYLMLLRHELQSLASYLDRDPSAPIEHCRDWTLYNLADDAGGNRWAATAAADEHGGAGGGHTQWRRRSNL